MKRLLAILLALTLVLSMAACTSAPAKTEEDADAPAPAAQPEEKPTEEEKAPEEEAPAAEPVELIVFAAASMTETLTEIGSKFMEQNPNVTIQFNFDSSGTLKTQIQNGAECDVFISAGQKQMNQLDKDASAEVNTEGLISFWRAPASTSLRTRSRSSFPTATLRASSPSMTWQMASRKAPSCSAWATPTFPSASTPRKF